MTAQVDGQDTIITGEVLDLGSPKAAVASHSVHEHQGRVALSPRLEGERHAFTHELGQCDSLNYTASSAYTGSSRHLTTSVERGTRSSLLRNGVTAASPKPLYSLAVPRRRVVIDHLTVGVSDLARSRDFYARALTPLGFAEIGPWRAGGHEVAFGLDEAADFAISAEYGTGASVHVAFAADRREQVDGFYAAALAAGGRDNGPPGLRSEYSDDYYGAFVLDPDGHNIEAVHHGRT